MRKKKKLLGLGGCFSSRSGTHAIFARVTPQNPRVQQRSSTALHFPAWIEYANGTRRSICLDPRYRPEYCKTKLDHPMIAEHSSRSEEFRSQCALGREPKHLRLKTNSLYKNTCCFVRECITVQSITANVLV